MIEVGVGEINVERRGSKMVADAEKSGAGVERDSQFGQKQTAGMAPV
jgi:hypothetical protein